MNTRSRNPLVHWTSVPARQAWRPPHWTDASRLRADVVLCPSSPLACFPNWSAMTGRTRRLTAICFFRACFSKDRRGNNFLISRASFNPKPIGLGVSVKARAAGPAVKRGSYFLPIPKGRWAGRISGIISTIRQANFGGSQDSQDLTASRVIRQGSLGYALLPSGSLRGKLLWVNRSASCAS